MKMIMIMKKETSDNTLREKMEAFNEVDAMNTRNYQPVWDRLEDKLYQKNKRKIIRFYFAAAAILLVIFAGVITRYQLNDKPKAHLVIQDLPVKKTRQVLQSNLAADSFAHPAKPGQHKLILNNHSKKKITRSMRDDYNSEESMQNNEAITPMAKVTEEVANSNLAEPTAAIKSVVNSIAATSLKKPALKVLHINEIYYGSSKKQSEAIKEPNVNWLFTTNNIKPENREAGDDYLPVTRKKSIFSIPLQKQNSN